MIIGQKVGELLPHFCLLIKTEKATATTAESVVICPISVLFYDLKTGSLVVQFTNGDLPYAKNIRADGRKPLLNHPNADINFVINLGATDNSYLLPLLFKFLLLILNYETSLSLSF